MAPMAPADVQALFSGEMSDRHLCRCLDTLRADPAWHVLDPFTHGSEWLFQMVYRPTGQPLGVAARQVSPSLWRFAAESEPASPWSYWRGGAA